ncbi:hypothetical protein [Paludisphaera mucosa]|uniref:Uncharacterized protein n=1 Tax=Paludisphaera mucosa TaxID=3030827 RepID=A0ABT6F594_9BACT|nr:hypothetical protein [Paludisphaera mucosa]MDG3002575.1 hypothetical protein [Paludisphaera mucosa]
MHWTHHVLAAHSYRRTDRLLTVDFFKMLAEEFDAEVVLQATEFGDNKPLTKSVGRDNMLVQLYTP